MRNAYAALTASLLMLAAPAAAETLRVEGVYGARGDIPPEIEVIALEHFAGDWGYELRQDLSDILSAPVDGGRPFYRVIPEVLAGGADNRPDAALTGAAHSWVEIRRASPRVYKECVQRDDKDKCVEKREVRVPCREMRVTYEPRITLVARDGTWLHHSTDILQASRTYCRDDFLEPDPDAMIEELAEQFALAMRGEFTPNRVASTPRLLEQRKGLSGGQRKAFKRALKLTDSDPYGACLAFGSLEQASPDHVSVLFNIGLCHESEGRLDEAEAYYLRALEARPDKTYVHEGLGRIASRRRGAAQLAARGRASVSD